MSVVMRVPQPPTMPFVGNLRDLDTDRPVQGLMRLAETYGGFFKVSIPGMELFVAGSQEIVNELCDETRFGKKIDATLEHLRPVVADALFTAHDAEPNWGKAHRILVPAFGPLGVRSMFGGMRDIAEQMMLRWERFGPDTVIDVPGDMTRLTLDTIALCAFDFRFNSFYRDGLHPFVGAMTGALDTALRRALRPGFVNALDFTGNRKFEVDTAMLHQVAGELIAERRADPDVAGKDDLLGRMINGVDPETGEGLSDENIANQMVTFLVAGHETTSGLLSFATYLLLRNPRVLERARQLVDEVVGDDVLQVEHLAKLRYLEQILMESLRLWPTAAAFAVAPHETTTLAGKYRLTPDDVVMVVTPILHRDRTVWGEDVEEFVPERFEPARAEKLPPNAWKPFGNGARACIGRPFAMQEAHLVLAMMLQRFDLALDDPNYQLSIHESLTMKPENLRIRVTPRRTAATLNPAPREAPATAVDHTETVELDPDTATGLLVLFGGNSGSSEQFAARIAGDAARYGFASTLAPLDAKVDELPSKGAVIVVTASYEGQPPDNARRMIPALEALEEGALSGVSFAVFGNGSRQWARTYQAIPKRVDAALERAGATRIIDRGEADSGGDFFGDFDTWYAQLWPAIQETFGKDPVEVDTSTTVTVEMIDGGRQTALQLPDLGRGVVVENRELTDLSSAHAASKRHLEVVLPPGSAYRAGDYLAVLPRNDDAVVERVLRRFAMTPDTMIRITAATGRAGLPVGEPISVFDLLTNYVELTQPATRGQVAALASPTRCTPERADLDRLADTDYDSLVLGKRMSVIDLLERYQSVPIEFATFLQMLPPMKARQYSISSSPLWNPDRATLTIAVVDEPARSGQGRFRGTTSGYLADREPGDRISVAVRPSHTHFHPPANPQTPIVLICAGSGIAPFRGFLQERAIQKHEGQQVGKALLFFGARHPDVDYLYRDELAGWEARGIVRVIPAFSREPGTATPHVQDQVWEHRTQITDSFQHGGTVYLCGDGERMAPAVRDTLVRIYQDAAGVTRDAAEQWMDTIEREQGRFVADIFA
ncbi:MAG: cytochrome [Gordonia sp. (in: high G+C Gram-positive bacteria)]|nr:MAG: cytochrome [Gordonia sp. (in: high G+C Gram-positive bacteria)]